MSIRHCPFPPSQPGGSLLKLQEEQHTSPGLSETSRGGHLGTSLGALVAGRTVSHTQACPGWLHDVPRALHLCVLTREASLEQGAERGGRTGGREVCAGGVICALPSEGQQTTTTQHCPC